MEMKALQLVLVSVVISTCRADSEPVPPGPFQHASPRVPFADVTCSVTAEVPEPPTGGYCLAKSEVFGEVSDRGDSGKSYAECPPGQVVTFCECVMVSSGTNGRHCEGVIIEDDGRTCKADGARNAGSFKARAVCGEVGWTNVYEPDVYYPAQPAVQCDQHEVLLGCYAHTFENDLTHVAIPVVNGNTCTTPAACDDCTVTAICQVETTCTNIAKNCACSRFEEGETVTEGESEAYCLPGETVMDCHCELDGGQYCAGVTVSKDARRCIAHAAPGGGGIKAKTCCGRLGGKAHVRANAKHLGVTLAPATASCDEGHELLACYGYKADADATQVQQETTITGNSCSLSAACTNCHVEVVCFERKECGDKYGHAHGHRKGHGHGHGHAHGHGHDKGHGHDHDEEHGHGHGHDEEHGHGHGKGHGHGHGKGHGHGHGKGHSHGKPGKKDKD